MYEDRPEIQTPPRVRAALHAYGGSTPDGRPLWRLILAQGKRVRAAGVMRTMPKDFEGAGIPKPEKLEEGVFWVPRYKLAGWILERWFPGSTWGSEQLWEAEKGGADGRTRMRAGWPRNGDYFLLSGPWPTIPTLEDLKATIREYMKQENEKPQDWDAMLRGELAEEMVARSQLAQAYEERMASVSRQQVSPVLGSLSSAAQRLRNKVAIELGGEDWHLGAF